jgi:hypothetical protein
MYGMDFLTSSFVIYKKFHYHHHYHHQVIRDLGYAGLILGVTGRVGEIEIYVIFTFYAFIWIYVYAYTFVYLFLCMYVPTSMQLYLYVDSFYLRIFDWFALII